jgi:hypothetical protein
MSQPWSVFNIGVCTAALLLFMLFSQEYCVEINKCTYRPSVTMTNIANQWFDFAEYLGVLFAMLSGLLDIDIGKIKNALVNIFTPFFSLFYIPIAFMIGYAKTLENYHTWQLVFIGSGLIVCIIGSTLHQFPKIIEKITLYFKKYTQTSRNDIQKQTIPEDSAPNSNKHDM